MDKSAGLKRGQVKLLEQIMKLTEEVQDIKEMILLNGRWKMNDMVNIDGHIIKMVIFCLM